jgi:hypothetical protein
MLLCCAKFLLINLTFITMKKIFLLAALCSAALFVACSNDDEPTPDPAPAKAAVQGGNANVCPAVTVTLTASAEGATSFVWYNGDTKITGAVSASYDVTATGTYYAAGVNGSGEGDKSDAKAVTISACLTAPAKAAVQGDGANTCPAVTVTLTASAASATSFVWYNGDEKIAGATAASYEVTAAGTYCAAGVNAAGEGPKSDAKAVAITACVDPLAALLGTWNGSEYYFDFDDEEWYPNSFVSEITKVDDQTISISNFVGVGVNLIATAAVVDGNIVVSVSSQDLSPNPTQYPYFGISAINTGNFANDFGTDFLPMTVTANESGNLTMTLAGPGYGADPSYFNWAANANHEFLGAFWYGSEVTLVKQGASSSAAPLNTANKGASVKNLLPAGKATAVKKLLR